MKPTGRSGRPLRRALATLVALALLGALGAGLAHGERSQRGNLVVSLDGGLTPLKLPRDRPAPVGVHLEGGLKTTDGGLLPRVTTVELGLPGRRVLTTRGLPTCTPGKLRDATREQALAACGDALVGHGRVETLVLLPNQQPFLIRTTLLAFNGTVGGERAVVAYAFAADPPTVVVIPFLIRHREGRFGTVLVAHLAPTLGPWPRFAHFELALSRRFAYRGRTYSYLSATCPIPRSNTAGFFSFARASFKLEDGGEVGIGIARSCRASRAP